MASLAAAFDFSSVVRTPLLRIYAEVFAVEAEVLPLEVVHILLCINTSGCL